MNKHLMRKISSLPSFSYPKHVRIVEVGPRDGLQNEKTLIPTDIKVELIDMLSDTGLQNIEAASFVSARYVPQMGDHSEVMKSIKRKPGVSYPVLTPNLKGAMNAMDSGCDEIAVFASATEEFSKANLNCTIKQSFERFKPVVEAATQRNVKVRGYVSCVLGCPYHGPVEPEAVTQVTEELLKLGCYEVSLGDTIGIGTAGDTFKLISYLNNYVDLGRLAVHCHDTYGQALANILMAVQCGVNVVDSSVSGLGGCPFAKGATGNVATEDVVYMLHGLGIETGIDLHKLIAAGEFINAYLGKEINSRAARAIINKRS